MYGHRSGGKALHAPMTRVAIIGGGITGLSAAYHLLRGTVATRRLIEPMVFERESRWGGKILTVRKDGFIVECGPDSFFSQKTAAADLCRELRLGDDLIPSNDTTYHTRVLWRGQLRRYPAGFRFAIPTRLLPFLFTDLLSPWGKLRMAIEPWIPPRCESGDESVASFVRRRLGREALERLAGPLMGAIYVGCPEQMSLQATFPILMDLERRYGSLIRGRRAMRQQRERPRAMFTTLRAGMGELVTALTRAIGTDRLNANSTVVALERRSSENWRIRVPGQEPFDCQHVILAIPPAAAARLLEPLAPELACELRKLRSVSSAVVNIAYQDAALRSVARSGVFGFVVPASEPCQLLAMTWSSAKFHERAPPGCHLLRAFIGGPGREAAAELPSPQLIDLVRTELERWVGLRADPLHTWITQWPESNPQYDVGHFDRIAYIEALARRLQGLHLAGGAYRGVGVPDCIRSGAAAATAVYEASCSA